MNTFWTNHKEKAGATNNNHATGSKAAKANDNITDKTMQTIKTQRKKWQTENETGQWTNTNKWKPSKRMKPWTKNIRNRQHNQNLWMRHLFVHTWPIRRNWQQCSSNMTSNILHRTKRMQTNSCDSTRIKRQLTTGHNTKRNKQKKANKIKSTEYKKEPRLWTSNSRRSNWRPTKANKQARETRASADNRRNRSNLKQPNIKEMHEPTET